jgi:hypothetical protein
MKVIIELQIHGCFASFSSEDIYVYKEFDLPFVPSKEITISHKTKKGEIDYIEISEVTWDDDSEIFKCFAPSDKEIYDARLNNKIHRPIKQIVNEYFEADWKIEEKYLERLNKSQHPQKKD